MGNQFHEISLLSTASHGRQSAKTPPYSSTFGEAAAVEHPQQLKMSRNDGRRPAAAITLKPAGHPPAAVAPYIPGGAPAGFPPAVAFAPYLSVHIGKPKTAYRPPDEYFLRAFKSLEGNDKRATHQRVSHASHETSQMTADTLDTDYKTELLDNGVVLVTIFARPDAALDAFAPPGTALDDDAFAPPGVFPPPVAFERPGAALGDDAFAPPGVFPPPDAFARSGTALDDDAFARPGAALVRPGAALDDGSPPDLLAPSDPLARPGAAPDDGSPPDLLAPSDPLARPGAALDDGSPPDLLAPSDPLARPDAAPDDGSPLDLLATPDPLARPGAALDDGTPPDLLARGPAPRSTTARRPICWRRPTCPRDPVPRSTTTYRPIYADIMAAAEDRARCTRNRLVVLGGI